MALVPGFCANCNNFFFKDNFVGDGFASVSLKNVWTDCPGCGASAQLLDGVYQLIGETVKILSAPQNTHRQFERLAEILRHAKAGKATAAQTAQAIESELPQFSGITKFFKHDVGFITILAVLLAAVSTYTGLMTYLEPQQINNERVYEEMFKLNQRIEQLENRTKLKKRTKSRH